MQNIHAVRPGLLGFLQLIHAAKHADIILCGGGGLFQDDDSLIKMPYWALRVVLVRLFCNKIIGYSLGVGPLSAPTSRLFARLAFSCMQHISTRDPIAQRTAQNLTRKPVISFQIRHCCYHHCLNSKQKTTWLLMASKTCKNLSSGWR